MSFENHLTVKSRLNALYYQVADIHPNKRGDLTRMWKHAQTIWVSMDLEMVNCRRLNKITPHYTSLESAILESLDTLEQYIMWASLLG